MNEKKDNLTEIINFIQKANEAYLKGDPIISDKEFDALVNKYNFLKQSDSIKSMKSFFTLEDCSKELDKLIYYSDVVVEPKFDGMTLKLTYKDGKLISALTKGNSGQKEVLEMVNNINIPLTIPLKGLIFVRGELIIKTSVYKERFANTFSSVRSCTCGAVLSKDINCAKERNVEFFAFEFIDSNNNSKYLDIKQQMSKYFDVLYTLDISRDKEYILNNIQKYFDYKCNYPCDGIVFKINDLSFKNNLGVTNTDDKSMFALKPDLDSLVTEVTDIKILANKTGRQVPIVYIKPITFNSVTNKINIKKVSAGNLSIIKNKKIGINSIISISLKSIAIPVIDKVILSTDYNMPDSCAECNTKLDEKFNCVFDNCGAKKQFLILDMLKILKIKGGEKTALILKDFINNVFDLLDLTFEKCLKIFKSKKTTENFYNSILEAKKNISAQQVLSCFPIPLLKSRVNKLFIYKNLYEISQISLENLQSILGKKIGLYLYDFFRYNELYNLEKYKFI